MKRLNEITVSESFVGATVNEENLNTTCCRNRYDADTGTAQFVMYCGFPEPEQRDLFGITRQLTEKWDHDGIEFSVYLTVTQGKITECHIYKEKETSSSARPTTRAIKPTQEELYIFLRVMEHITTG